MAPKIQKSRPAPQTEPETTIEGGAATYVEEIATESQPELIGSFSADLPSEEEQEALRVKLREAHSGTGEAAAFQNPTATDLAQVQPIAVVALGRAGLGLHHGYPPHNPGEGIQGGVSLPNPSGGIQGGVNMANPYVNKPSVGRIVHFSSPEYPDPVAAIVTGVYPQDDTMVDLYVLRRLEDPRIAARVVQGPAVGAGRRWYWPARG